MYTLRNITDEYYDELKSKGRLASLRRPLDEEDDTSKKIHFYQDKVKNFNAIIHAVDLIEEMEELKKLSSTNYDFDVEGRRFVITLLREFTEKLDPLRRGEIYKVDSEFIIYLYKGFLHIFESAEAEPELLERVSLKLYNRLDVPVRIVQSTREAASKRLEKMIQKRMSGFTLGMNTLENYVWLNGMRNELNALIQKWDDLYYFMSEIRQEELNDVAEERARSMSADETYEAELDWHFSGEIMKAQGEDPEIQDLLKKKSKLTGIPFEELMLSYADYETAILNHKKFKHKKKKFVKDIEDKLEEVIIKIAERSEQVRVAVIREHIPDYQPPEESEEEPDYSFLMTAEAVLEKAFEDQKEAWEWDKEREKRAAVVLPEKSMEELRKELDELFPVGKQGHFQPNIEEE